MDQVSNTVGDFTSSIGSAVLSGVQSSYNEVLNLMPKSGFGEFSGSGEYYSGDYSGDNDAASYG